MRAYVLTVSLVLCSSAADLQTQVDEHIRTHQYDLPDDGRAFLLREASRASFFLLGELHGDNESPALIRDLWPSLWQGRYRHIAAEISPWKSEKLADPKGPSSGLWMNSDVAFVNSQAKGSRSSVLWGCDMEELRPDLLIVELASRNPRNAEIEEMARIAKPGYQRAAAPELLALLRKARGIKDVQIGGASLQENLLKTLEIEADRLSRERLQASNRREALMKDLFIRHYRKAAAGGGRPKVMARFGRNHLHRGLDRRGVSTLGNFIAEFALAEQTSSFHLAVFGAGGSIFWAGQLMNWDERKDDPAFELLASHARFDSTVFDLRPLRRLLHASPESARTPALTSLIYWSDSYDAIICYRKVSPLAKTPPVKQ